VADELFVEALEPVEAPSLVAVCCDTSGSTASVLGKFCGELEAIGRMCGGRGVDLYWADAELIGPLGIEEAGKPRGGGGTSFVPFFEEAEKRKYRRVVYLTDLDGLYPATAPKCEVTWAVPPGCRENIPFGKVVKIL
jgi:predicted metal-dependent peptidase